MKSKYQNLNSKQRRKIRTLVCRRDNYKCAYCGMDLLSSPILFHFRSVDHLEAIGNGGDSLDIDNMVCCCHICNNMKSDYTAKNIEDAKSYIECKKIEFDALYTAEKKRFRQSWFKKFLRLFW